MRAARMVWLARLLPAATVVFLGCGGSDGPGSPNPSISIAPASATTSAGADPTTFTATRTGVAEAASWSLDGPGTLSTTSGDAISYTPPDILDEPATATLTATAGELSAKATITVNPAPSGPPVTVSGTVVDSCLRPMADVVVWIRNRGITRTDASGGFSFTGVPTPYTIGTMEDYRDWKRIRIYAGLTADQVRLTLAHAEGPLRQGALEGTFSIGSGATAQVPVPLGRRTWFSFTPPGAIGSLGAMDVNPYHLDAAWCGDPTTDGAFEALQWTTQTNPNNPNIAAEFNGYGRTTATAAEGTTTAGQDVVLDSVGTTSLSGTINAPPGYLLLNRRVGLDPGAGVQPLLLFNFVQTSQGVPADFTVPVPDAPGIQLGIQTEAATDGGDSQSWLRQVSPGGSITLGMDPAPTMVSPSAGAAVDLATQSFTWQSSVGGVQGLFVTILVPTGGGFINWVDYQAFTMGRSFRVPSPAEFGLSAVPAGSRGEWHVGTSNEPTLARLAGTGSPVLLAGGILSVMLPVPESAEVRFATATADGRFTLP